MTGIDRDALARVIAQAFYCDPLDPAEMDPDDLTAALRAGGEAADGVLREWPHLAATGPRDAGLRHGDHAYTAAGYMSHVSGDERVIDKDAEIQRLRARIHEAVDECQRRYAPQVKELARMQLCRRMAADYFAQAEPDAKWSRYALMSEVERTYIADLIQQRDQARADLAVAQAREARVRALLADGRREFIYADNLRRALDGTDGGAE